VRVDGDLATVDDLDDLDLTAVQHEGTVRQRALAKQDLAGREVDLLHRPAQPCQIGGVQVGKEGHHAQELLVATACRSRTRFPCAAHDHRGRTSRAGLCT
jgi:hypothetical protein